MRFLCCLQVLLFLLSYQLSAQSPPTNATSSLDSLLQDYSFRAFVRPRTGILYDATVPPNLTGIKLSAMRLRSGSLRRRGVSSLKEFTIPKGVIAKPYVTRLVFVYQNLANFSRSYYPLPGYDYVAPVVGLLAYDAKNLSAVNLPELEITASRDPIRIDFSDLEPIPTRGGGGSVQCVRFDSRGRASFSDSIQPGNACETVRQGHFSVVVKSVPSAPSPAPAPAPDEKKKKSSESNSRTWITVGSVLGGLVLLGLLLLLVLRCRSYKKQERMKEMERAGETGEALRMTQVGETRAPTATTTRTQPVLETEYAA
ncbi:hypothetical protein Bca101_084556 [Brassica carinata]